MCHSLKFLLFILAIQRHSSVDCYAPGSLIWSRNLQKFIPVANVSTFGAYEQEIVAKSREKETHNFQGAVIKLGSVKMEKMTARQQNGNVPIVRYPIHGPFFSPGTTANEQIRILVSHWLIDMTPPTINLFIGIWFVYDYNMVKFVGNGNKITGVCGEIWNTLAEYSNFTLVTIKVPALADVNKKWRFTTLGMITQNITQIIPRMAFTSLHSNLLDYTTPIWETRYRIYIKPEWKSDANWMFNIFEKKVWFAILLCFLLLSAIGYLLQNISIKVSGDENQRHNLSDHLFYTFATLCSQGFIPDTLDRRSQIFGVSKKIFAWLLLIVLSSHVISHMTNVKLHPPFEDIESLLKNTNYKISIYVNSIGIKQYRELRKNLTIDGVCTVGRMKGLTPQKRLYKSICSSEQQALFELEDTKEAFGNRFCEMVAVGKSYFPAWITFGISKAIKYKRTFDIGILKMKEFGLIDRLKNRWLKTSFQTVDADDLVQAQFTPVTLEQVFMLFIILGIGMVVAAIIFVLEIVVSVYKSNQHQRVSKKTLIGKPHRPPRNHYLHNRMRRKLELSDLRRMPIYVQNIFVAGSKCPRAQDNDR